MMDTFGGLRLCVCIVLAAFVGLSGCSKKKEPAPKEEGRGAVIIEKSMMAPDVPMRSLDGASPFLADYRGKIVLLHFWSTMNADCKEQIPILGEIAAEYQRYDIVVLGVSIDKGGESALRSFLQTNKVGYPTFYNGVDVIGKFGGLRKLPTTYFITRDGRIYFKALGPQSKAFYRIKIKDMLKQRL